MDCNEQENFKILKEKETEIMELALRLELTKAEAMARRLRNETWETAYSRMKRVESIKEKEEAITKAVAVTTVLTVIGTTAFAAKNHTAIEAEVQRIVSTQHTSLTNVEPQEAVQLPEVELSEVAEAVEMVADKAPKAAAKAEAEATAKAEAKAATKAEAEAQVAEAQVAEAQVAEAQVAEVQVAEAQVAEAQVAEAQVAEAQVAEAQVAEAQVAEAQVAETQVTEVQVSEVPVVEAPVAEAQAVEAQVGEAQSVSQLSSITHNGVTIRFFPVSEEILWQYAVKTGNYSYTEEDLRYLEKVICVEARGEGLAGQIIVANTVINRAKQWGGSIHEIITSQGQFASISGVTDSMITDEMRQAAKMAFEVDLTEGVMKAVAGENGFDASYYQGGSLYFFNPEGCSQNELQKRKNITGIRYRGHVFYTK